MTDLNDKVILVTGAHGFLGTHLIDVLSKHDPKEILNPTKEKQNLLDPINCRELTQQADIVIHAAAKVAGIEANRKQPGEFFYENALMGIQLIEAARLANVEKFIQIGSACEYPKTLEHIPFLEKDLWKGYPEETSSPYGLAKKMLLVQGQAYRQQYQMNIIHLLVVNMYGPNDHFGEAHAHVIAALVDRFWQAKQKNLPEVVCWGTGSATREFLYVKDAARGIAKAAQLYDGIDPVNLASGYEISIKNLAELIAQEIGYQGNITWDTTKPDGQPRRSLDTSKAKKHFDFEAQTTFEDGIKKTISWYTEHATKQVSEKASV